MTLQESYTKELSKLNNRIDSTIEEFLKKNIQFFNKKENITGCIEI